MKLDKDTHFEELVHSWEEHTEHMVSGYASYKPNRERLRTKILLWESALTEICDRTKKRTL